MPIAQPDQPDIVLGQSQIRPVDTYASPMRSSQGMSDGAALGNALAQLGQGFEGLGEKAKAKQEQLDGMSTEYMAGQIRSELKDGVPYDTQVGSLLPEKSSVVRARVGESLGYDAGQAFINSEKEKLLQDQQLRLDPEAMNARLAQIRSQAAAQVKGSPFYGAGYLKAVEAGVTQIGAASQGERAPYYQQKQTEQYLVDDDEKQKQALAGEPTPYPKVPEGQGPTQTPTLHAMTIRASEGPDSIDKLNAGLATKLDSMLHDMPENLRNKVSIDSAYRSTEHQKQIHDEAVAKYGEAGANHWAASPGHSMHNHGEAVDLGGVKDDPEVKDWVHSHAAQYGLYFPMAHEPWHIEQIGGMRQKGKSPTAPDGTPIQAASLKTDGPSSADPVQIVANKIGGVESGNNPNTQNPRSSAGGIGQFTDDTWLASARKYAPGDVMGKSDDQILAMKKGADNVDLQRKVLLGFTQDNAERVKNAGAAVTPGNIYLMHFAGEGDGPKLLKADDNASVRSIMTPASIAANPQIANMTVGQIKQWASDKMGGANGDPGARARNATRQVYTQWGRSSSLGDMARQQAVIDYRVNHAVTTGDKSGLSTIPPEWINHEVQDKLTQAETKADAVTYHKFEQQRAMATAIREEDKRQLIQKMDEDMVAGRPIDIATASRGRDGQINHEAFEYAQKQQDTNLRVSDVASKTNAAKFEDSVSTAATTGDWGVLDRRFSGQTPRMDELREYVAGRADLRSGEKQALVGKMDNLVNAATAVNSPEAKEMFNTQIGDYAKQLQSNQLTGGKMSQMAGVNYLGNAQKFYDTELRDRFKAATETDGQVPFGEKARGLRQAAADRTMSYLKDLSKLVSDGDQKKIDAKTVLGKTSEESKSTQAAQPQYDMLDQGNGHFKIVPRNQASPPQAQPLQPIPQSGPVANPVDPRPSPISYTTGGPPVSPLVEAQPDPVTPTTAPETEASAPVSPVTGAPVRPNGIEQAITKRIPEIAAGAKTFVDQLLTGPQDSPKGPAVGQEVDGVTKTPPMVKARKKRSQ